EYANDWEVGDAGQRYNKREEPPEPFGINLNWILSCGDAAVGEGVGHFKAFDGPEGERCLQDHQTKEESHASRDREEQECDFSEAPRQIEKAHGNAEHQNPLQETPHTREPKFVT